MNEALALGQQGHSPPYVARTLGIPRTRVVKEFESHGLTVKSRPRYSEDEVQRIIAFHEQGLTAPQIARELSMWPITVRALLVKAGYTPIVARPTYSKETDDRLLDLYQQGYTANKIANILNIATSTVVMRLRKLGAEVPSVPVYTETDKQQIIALFMQGHSPNAIAKQLKIASLTVRKFLRQASLEVKQVPLHTEQEIASILKLRRKGKSVTAISDELKIPVSSVFYWVVRQPDYESKVNRRFNSRRTRTKVQVQTQTRVQASNQPAFISNPKDLSDSQIIQTVRLHRQGKTVSEISEMLKLTKKLVKMILG